MKLQFTSETRVVVVDTSELSEEYSLLIRRVATTTKSFKDYFDLIYFLSVPRGTRVSWIIARETWPPTEYSCLDCC